MDRYTYRDILGSLGSDRRERIINKSKHDTLHLAPDSPAYKSVEIDGEPHYVMVISTNLTTTKVIRTMPGDDFDIGSIMLWSGSHWLITERDSDDDITVRGKIEVCQREILWQDDDSLDILSSWATVDKPYFSNLSENKVMTYSSREFKLQIPYNDSTAKINIGKRLMLEVIDNEPKTYRVTSVDQMTKRINRNDSSIGFIIINIEQDLYNPMTDNADLMICDYVDPTTVSTDDTSSDETPPFDYPFTVTTIDKSTDESTDNATDPVASETGGDGTNTADTSSSPTTEPTTTEPDIDIEVRAVSDEEQEDYTLEIKYSGNPTLRAGGLWKTFKGLVNGEPASCNWRLIGATDGIVPDKIYLQSPDRYSATGEVCKVKCNEDVNLIGKTVYLVAVYKSKHKSIMKYVELEVVSV